MTAALKATHNLSGHHVLVTGAAQGVGRAVAELCRDSGADVTAVDRVPRVEELAAPAEPARGSVRARVADLGDEGDLAALVDETAASDVDLLVNCAAAYPPGDLLGSSDADWLRVMRVNVLAAAALSRAVAGRLVREARPGAIVNVGSVQESLPLPGHSAYVASKGALQAMTNSLAVELGTHGIRVNSVTLGLVHSEALDAKLGSGFWGDHDAVPPTLLRRTGSPREAAEAIVYLCSPAASYVTGAVLAVDGGRRLSRLPDPQFGQAPAAARQTAPDSGDADAHS